MLLFMLRATIHATRQINSIVLVAMAMAAAPVLAQVPPAQPVTIGDVSVTGSLRTRVEMWDWFDAEANDEYAFSGSLLRLALTQSRQRYAWQLELAAPILLGLPDDAIALGAQGQLGLGASYFAANNGHRNDGMLFVKQAFVQFKNLAGVPSQSLKIGRMEFIDGTEVTPNNATLAALARDRIAHRLLGNFGFSHVGRSFDGIQYTIARRALQVTALAARPTRGVFQVDGWGELNVNVYYGALTGQTAGAAHAAEWRVFGLGYRDGRTGVVKTDNRPLAVRRADAGTINVATIGGHYIDAVNTHHGAFDVLLWGATQFGSWGALSHRASAFAAEAGWQPPGRPRLRPWIRGGYDYGSGDGDPGDTTHGTFFQVLPTPRVYARFPFFNMMNNGDGFVELVLRPSTRLNLRADVHALRLADANDLWYQGGGAFQPDTFGYAGRPSNGQTGLATMYDGSVDYTINPHAAIGGYVGWAVGGLVTRSIYPNGRDASFGYLEMTLRF